MPYSLVLMKISRAFLVFLFSDALRIELRNPLISHLIYYFGFVPSYWLSLGVYKTSVAVKVLKNHLGKVALLSANLAEV